MNFNYSYRAFLITSLLTGSLVLFLISVKLTGNPFVAHEDTYDMLIAPEELIEDEENLTQNKEELKVETNKAYNEAETFISSIENENHDLTETTEGKLQEIDEAIEKSQIATSDAGQENISKPTPKKKKDFSNTDNSTHGKAVIKGANINTTITYRLVGRTAIVLPNPVYTCYKSGRIVINIEVNTLGNVIKATYNKSASSTTDQCLIDAALEYARQAQFSSDASQKSQLGSISFNFPGQG